MALEGIVNIGACILGGGMKGWADEMGIELGLFDFALPIIGVVTIPALSAICNTEEQHIVRYTCAAGVMTAASYGLARGAAILTKFYTS